MGVITRVKNIVRANTNAVLEKFENPEVVMRDSIERMEKDFARCRDRVGQILAESKVSKKRQAFHACKAEEWEAKARLALRKEKEDLAREALERKDAEARRADECAAALVEQETAAEEAKAALIDLKERIEKARVDMGEWVARERKAKTRLNNARRQAEGKAPVGASPTVTSAFTVSSDAIEEFDRIVRRIEETECLADAQEELARDARLGPRTASSTASAEPKEYAPEVELELERLKEEMNGEGTENRD